MYYFLLIYLIFVFIMYSKQNKVVFLVLIGSGLILFSGLRYNSGIDYLSYKNLYELECFSTSEVLFWLLMILHKNIFNSYESFLFLVTLVSISIKLYLINKFNPKYLWLSILIFISVSYISVDMGLIRNSLAFMFFILSVYYLYIESNKTSYFYFFIAFLFHHSVIFLIFIYFINKYSEVSRFYLFALISTFLLSIFNIFENAIYEFVNLEFIKNHFVYINWKINHYLIGEDYQSKGLNLYTLRIFLIAIILYVFHKRLSNNYFLKVYIFGTCILLLMAFNVQFYTRLGLYLSLFEILLIPQLLYLFKGWTKVIISFVLIVMYVVLFFRTSYIFEIYKVNFL